MVVLFLKMFELYRMEKMIDGYHIQIMPMNDELMVFPDKAQLPLFMEWRQANDQWKFKDSASGNIA